MRFEGFDRVCLYFVRIILPFLLDWLPIPGFRFFGFALIIRGFCFIVEDVREDGLSFIFF